MSDLKVLFAGEAIYHLQTIFKGWDQISLGRYVEHGQYFFTILTQKHLVRGLTYGAVK